MDDRELDLTEAQKEVKAKYPQITKKYEYLDHTADVQIHSWGDSLEEAFEQCAMGMFGYMTDTETVEPLDTVEVESEGEDMESLLFHFLDDWLYKFSADLFFIPREVKVLHIDRMRFRIRSIGTVCHVWVLASSLKIWSRWLGRGKSGLLCLNCCLCDPDLRKSGRRWMDGCHVWEY
ncbi:protein archease isoform 1-T1 [Pholidichthys leucotaenia]